MSCAASNTLAVDADVSEAAQLQMQAQRIRASGILGRSRQMLRLFDFLLECSLTRRTPKEVEIAIDALGKASDFDVTQDALVRVYIHKMRRRLEEYYLQQGQNERARIFIPKGEYRFAIETVEPGTLPVGAEATVILAPAASVPGTRKSWLLALAAGLALSLALNGILLSPYIKGSVPADELSGIRSDPIWARILSDNRPITVVVGDYYIFGEADGAGEIRRLIREFSINSAADLERYSQLHPQSAGRYLDLQLQYLPTSTASALRHLMPLLAKADRRVRILNASELTPATLRNSDVIYVGYLSGLGILHNLVFSNSRFTFGESYDELVDQQSGTRYISQAAVPLGSETRYFDYGYFSTFAGPSGNQFVILSGMRDVSLMYVGNYLTGHRGMDELRAKAGKGAALEALYRVDAMDQLDFNGELVLASPLGKSRGWTDANRPSQR